MLLPYLGMSTSDLERCTGSGRARDCGPIPAHEALAQAWHAGLLLWLLSPMFLLLLPVLHRVGARSLRRWRERYGDGNHRRRRPDGA